MGLRRVASVLLAVGLLGTVAAGTAPAAPAPAAAPATFTISVAGAGPFAPGTAVSVSLSGGSASASKYVIIEQCGADADICGPSASLILDATGSGKTTIRVHRRLGSPGSVVDCATAPCQLTARSFDGVQTASTPIGIDGSVAIVPPVLTVEGPTPLPDRAHVTLRGTGFDPSSAIPLRECAAADASQCPDVEVGFAFTDDNGNFDTDVLVSRNVGTVDCAERPNRCQIFALPYGNIDHIVAVGLTFDPTNPPVFPQVTVVPSTNLRHQQSVTVTGTHFFPSAYGQVLQCVAPGQPDERCLYLNDASTGSDGAFTATVAVSRRVGLADCAVLACVLRVFVYPTDQVDVAIAFDRSVRPPPVPSVAVKPHTGLTDRQVVDIEIRGAEPGTYVFLSLCRTDGSACRANVSGNVTSAVTVIPMALPRILSPTVDCAVVSCEVVAQLYGGDSYEFKIPVGFDPDAPLAGSADIQVLPARGLWDRQRVEVRGERFDPGANVSARQCISTDGAEATCSAPTSFQVGSNGTFSGRFTVRRVLQLADGAHDCVAVACSLVVDGDPPIAFALGFDASGPLRGSDLPPQLKCVAWPTQGWPTGALPAGVDAAKVEAAGTQMVGPNAGDSVVVIHGGRLVYEKYAQGVTADSILPSFSVSKSFTSTMVGLLVDEGRLKLDDRAPVPEWADPADPRHAITLRNLLNMSSGLQWNEDYGSTQSDVFQMAIAADEAAYVIAKPLEAAPGSRWHYSTGDTEVLSRIVGDTAGVRGDAYKAYLHQRLLDPLGINPVDPGIDGSGNWMGGWWTNTTTRNFAKLGLLYLRNGVWEDKQFLSSDWVDFVRTPTPSFSGYGGQFWLNGDGSFEMIGIQGQSVHIIPDLDLIIAVNNGQGDSPMVDAFRNAEPASCGDDPSAADDTATVRALGAVDIDVLANDHGGDSGLAPATLTVSNGPAHGSAEVVGDRIRYDSDSGFRGTDTFGYVVCTNDRQRCVEAKVTVHVKRMTFEFRPPVRNKLNVRSPERGVMIRLKTPAGEPAVQTVTSVAVDCASGKALGEHEPVDAQLHANARRGLVWFRWSTTPTWTGCRDLEVVTADGAVHVAHFRWRAGH